MNANSDTDNKEQEMKNPERTRELQEVRNKGEGEDERGEDCRE